MFDGGFQVGVTVSPVGELFADELPLDGPAPGAVERSSRLGELLPVGWRSDAELAGDLARIAQIRAKLAAFEAELVVELAARRPQALDVPLGRAAVGSSEPDELVGGVSEFFADELALVANTSRGSATRLIEQAFALRTRVEATWAALADGALDHPRARAIAEELGRPADGSEPEVIAAVEAAVLPRAAGLSVRRLRDLVRKELAARDAAASERRRAQAHKTADVTSRPLPAGMGELVYRGPAQDVAAIRDTVDRYARQWRADGDARPIGVLRAEVLRELVLRPWDVSRPPVTAQVTIDVPLAALGGTAGRPGQPAPTGAVDGQPITATHLKELLEQLDVLGVQPPACGGLSVAITDATGTLLGHLTLRELRDRARRGCPDHPTAHHAAASGEGAAGDRGDRRAEGVGPAGDRPEDSGTGGGCGCAVLGPPPATGAYPPTAAQRRFLTTRDRTCRHPGCHTRAGWADLDHVIPYDHGGATDCDNLCCLCRRHHRLKTHAPGWRFAMAPDGTLTVTTPSGVTRVTRPPGLDDRDEPDPADDPPPF